jgi:hypothetical protein
MSTYKALELHIFWVPRPQGIIRAARSGFHEQCLEVGFVSPVARQLHNVDQIKPPAIGEPNQQQHSSRFSRCAPRQSMSPALELPCDRFSFAVVW